MKKRKKLLIILSAIILISALYVLIFSDNKTLGTTHYTVSSQNLPKSFDGFTIVQVSDLHNDEFGEGNCELFDAIKATSAKNIYYKSAKSTLLVESENVKCAIMPIGYKKQHETIGTFHYIDVSPSGEICIVTEIVTTEDTNKEIA